MANACFRSQDCKLRVRIINKQKNGFILLDHVLFKINWISTECNAPYVGFPSGLVVKNLPAKQEVQEMWVWCLGWEDLLEKRMATHSSTLAWRIPWTEEPGELQVTKSPDITEATEHTHMCQVWDIWGQFSSPSIPVTVVRTSSGIISFIPLRPNGLDKC